MEKKKFVLAVNNRNGLNALKIIKSNPEYEISFLLLHKPEKAMFTNEIIKNSELPQNRIFFWDKDKLSEYCEKIAVENVDVLLSVNFGYVIPACVLDIFPVALNLHTGYLPWNKGSHPNVWPFIDGSPAGVTLHVMTPELDAGPIIYRKKVEVTPLDNAKTLYEKLEKESIKVLEYALPKYFDGELQPFFPHEKGSFHSHKDFLKLFEIKLDRSYTGREIINLLRALTFPPYKNAYYIDNNWKVHIEISLSGEKIDESDLSD